MRTRRIPSILKALAGIFASMSQAGPPDAVPSERPTPTPAAVRDEWLGHVQETFVLAGRNCRVVMPGKPADGNPWIWRPEFFQAFNQADKALLGMGYHLAYMDMKNTFGCPAALQLMDQFHRHVTQRYQLSNKTTLFGFSRGGLYALNWAAGNPDKVACIYLDAPVCDFKSWPAGFGKGSGSPADWKKLLSDYGFHSEQEARGYKLNPIDNLQALAAARIPILSVCGDADTAVPYDENTAILKERYSAMGGPITVIMKPGVGHHPHSLSDPSPIIDFVRAANTAGQDTLEAKPGAPRDSP